MKGLIDDVIKEDKSSGLSPPPTCLVKRAGGGVGDELYEILMGGEMVGMKEVKKIVKEVDRKLLLSRCRGKAPMVASVGEDGGWLRLWDEALNLGERHTKGLKNLSRVLSHHGRGSKPCPLYCATGLQKRKMFSNT